ncbi:MAG: CDP-diacylglycerol--glycerol-3-phosphate 3-phosphatidyltransferase [Acutalibacteraceae bacterium]
MNLPNKLTLTRVIMTPLFMAAMLIDFKFHYIVALALFALASFTDYLDGMLARKHHIVTNFGKFLDPLADKMLTTSAFIAFLAMDYGKGIAWVLFIILFREFMVSSLRLVVVSSDKGVVIAANIFGKIKTVTQMVTVIYGIAVKVFCEEITVLSSASMALEAVFTVLIWLSALFTVISGAIYMKDSFDYINPAK